MEAQIVVTTLLVSLAVVAFGIWIYRMATDYDDNMWIEWVVIAVLGLFVYLVWK